MESDKNRVRFSLMGKVIAEQLPVVGVSFKNNDGTDRQEILEGLLDDVESKQYDNIRVLVQKEPDNEFDPNAIAVFIESSTTSGQIGYIEKSESTRLSHLYEAGKINSVSICSVGRGKNDKIGVMLEFVFDGSNI